MFVGTLGEILAHTACAAESFASRVAFCQMGGNFPDVMAVDEGA